MIERLPMPPSASGGVPTRWSVQSIEDLCLKVTSGGTPLRSNPSFYEGGTIPWFKTQELSDWYLEDSDEHITDLAISATSAKLFPPNTILMAMYGDGRTMTNLGILRRPAASNQACCALICDPSRCSHHYLFYALRYHRKDFLRLASGGAQRNLSGTLIRNFKIKAPSIEEQEAIGRVLAALDNKIALNRRTNQMLEAMARAIFKAWFVDFEAVGRWSPSPSAFTNGVMDRFLPRGWSQQPLDSIADFLNGLALQKYPANNGEEFLPVIKIAELRRGETTNSDRAGLDVPSDYVVDDGSVLFSWSGSLEVVVWTGGRGALNQHIFKVTSDKYPKWYYLYWLKEHLSGFRMIAADKATTMGHIQRHHLSEALVNVPPCDILQQADRLMDPLLEKQIKNNLESRTLATIRDALLPKLLSGEIRVKQAEKIVGEVT